MLKNLPNSMARQRGVVLMITLIVLVVMALAGVAMTRSVDTTNIIAGNLAFQQSTVQSADAGIETAIDWMEANAIGATLRNDVYASGYSAYSIACPATPCAQPQRDPAPGQTWDEFWEDVLVPNGRVVTLAPDAAGNTVSFTIQRLCDASGNGNAVNVSGCSIPPSSTITGNTKSGGQIPWNFNNQGYYRITVRVDGPRNAVSYTQAIAGM